MKYLRFAFTLAELLVSILILAIVLTLLTPVITKRVKSSLVINSTSYQSKIYTYDKSNPDCEEISGVDNVLRCKFTVPSGVSIINAIAVSAGGGGGYWYNNSNPLVGDGAQGQMGYVYLYWEK